MAGKVREEGHVNEGRDHDQREVDRRADELIPQDLFAWSHLDPYKGF